MSAIYLPLLITHICAAIIGLLSGFSAMVLRKGSGLHGAAGSVFFVSMLIMTTSAAYLAAFVKPNMLNLTAASLTFYLVSTAWRAAKNRAGKLGAFDLIATIFILAVGTGGITFGFEALRSVTGVKDHVPAPIYFIFGSVALLCAITDVRMFRRGGLFGMQRIARHLWRMSLALLIATLSLYPGQARIFPMAWRQTNLLFTPHILLIGAMIFWMARVSAKRKREQQRNVVGLRQEAAIVGGAVRA
jgi:hypothetical protein